MVNDHEEIFPLPSVRIILKGTMWVVKNIGYVLDKRKKVNERRKRTTKDLINFGVITN